MKHSKADGTLNLDSGEIIEVIAMLITVNLEDWEEICQSFRTFFKDLGVIETKENYIQFSSFPDNVATSFSISKEGKFAASMPLHALDGAILTVQFDYQENVVRILGSETRYTYKVPPEILGLRTEPTV